MLSSCVRPTVQMSQAGTGPKRLNVASRSRPLHVAYVALKSAFDSVNRKASWKALRWVGVLQVVMKFIEDLHTDTTSRIRLIFGSMMS